MGDVEFLGEGGGPVGVAAHYAVEYLAFRQGDFGVETGHLAVPHDGDPQCVGHLSELLGGDQCPQLGG